jgi:hypothetical protein
MFETIQKQELHEKTLTNNEFNTNIESLTFKGNNSFCLKDIDTESILNLSQYEQKSINCYSKKKDQKQYAACVGFDCLKGSFLYDPDEFNTSHNYSVLQECDFNNTDVYCTNNHQVFNNNTRRHVTTVCDPNNTRSGLPDDVPKFPEIEYNICTTQLEKKTDSCSLY